MNDTASGPFVSEFVVLMLLNPGLTQGITLRGPAFDEWRRVYGDNGEHASRTWREHEQWLRSYARRYAILPIFDGGRFYVEAAADAQERNR